MGVIAAYKRWRERRKRQWSREVEIAVYRQRFQKWWRENYWRLPPTEGWHVGYTCNYVPHGLQLWLAKNDQPPPPPTREEIAREANIPLKELQLFLR